MDAESRKPDPRGRAAVFALLVLYAFLILTYTVLCRAVAFRDAHTVFLWSYRAWFGGNRRLGIEILGNIALFVPFGLLLAACMEKRPMFRALLAGLLLSCLVELLQYRLMRGEFEFDDLLNNSLGAALGGFVCLLLRRFTGRHVRAAVLALGAAAVLIALGVCLRGGDTGFDYSPRYYCFQVDRVSAQGDAITLEGFALRYGHEGRNASLLLRSTRTGRTLPLRVEYGLERRDVDNYFRCEYDYAHTGFTASGSGLRAGEEYELLARFGWPHLIPTGVYLLDGEIRYAPAAAFQAPAATGTALAAIVEEGVLRAYLPELPCWIYQHGGALYWVLEKDYPFEEDGTTRFQYILWTTQEERIPADRLHKGLRGVDLGAYFEAHEQDGDFGPYRVMKRELPDGYAVTAVLTGVWTREDGWLWRVCFRPYYEF